MAKVSVTTKGKHTKKGAGRPLSYSQCIDDELLPWILRQRDLHVTVRRLDVQLKAKALIGSDLATTVQGIQWLGWQVNVSPLIVNTVRSFLHCTSLPIVYVNYYLICRARTSIQQKLPPQLEEKLERFTVNMKELWEIHQFENTMVINMDETPMYFDIPSSHTVYNKGYREVWIRSTGVEKRRLTAILACTASGDMLPPWWYSKASEHWWIYASTRSRGGGTE